MEKLNVDCLILIFYELRKDEKSLYSCLLVNKEWCHLVVPILWEKYPYLFFKKSRENFPNIILSYLPNSSKQLLFDNAISLPLTIFSKPPTFNYVSLCKYLRDEIIDNIIRVVLFKQGISKNIDYLQKRELLKQEIYKLFISQCKNVKELEWKTSQPLPSFPGALTCFSKLYSLNIDLRYVSSNNLHEMAQICKNLGELIASNCSQDTPGLISLIDAQSNLKSISFNFQFKKGRCEELSKALIRKCYTIKDLSLFWSFDIILLSFLTSFINLKYLKIYDTEKEFVRYLVNLKFPSLQFLDINAKLLYFKELAIIIERTNGNLSHVSLHTSNESAAENTGILLKTISIHCPKIENLITYIIPKDLIYVKSLLMNCRNLKDLHFKCLNGNNSDIGDELLNIMAKFSPKSLIRISLIGDWKYSANAFEKYFESYRGRKLHDFYINYYFRNHITNEHVDVVIKYYNEGIIVDSNLLAHHSLMNNV
ncbi:hypothetical protein RclHR1_03180009 [Rhizophagus clarus]|uniref:F-box domain-containing protein n=1 Tax=Rhizophagus clarus TaxID=94130 RepID=A0A2Z6RJJ4_9GLOM|nr:hypothetical protein RclHR1_03180009 [Rhizophagus clarus]GES92835.1 hypothetical protein GLOIN_2v1810914 [Rhizophagus clarus]